MQPPTFLVYHLDVSDTTTRLTVNLTPKATTALNIGSMVTGNNRTDVVNIALLVYSYLADLMKEGYEVQGSNGVLRATHPVKETFTFVLY